jgi:hypothetical protein
MEELDFEIVKMPGSGDEVSRWLNASSRATRKGIVRVSERAPGNSPLRPHSLEIEGRSGRRHGCCLKGNCGIDLGGEAAGRQIPNADS